MARSTRRSRRSSSSRSLPVPDSSDEEDVVCPYVPPARLESPFGTDRMAAAISLEQPQHQTREQRASAAEQELVAASLRRAHEAQANNRSAFGINADDDLSLIHI